MTTNAYIRGVKNNRWKPYQGKLWQRTFHDHVIRNETELNKLREYILHNPALWAQDRYYSDVL
jgi:REP element-mobilizing transposase RayT